MSRNTSGSDTSVLRVLIVEDNLADARLAEELLRERDVHANHVHFELTFVQSIFTALAQLRDESPDVILLDLTLPDSEGTEGLRRLTKEYNAIPIIVVSGIEDEATGIQAVHEGAQDFLTKGRIDSYGIRRAIHYAVERQRNRLELSQAREAANRAAQAKSDFLARMSHEIRTPLTPIVAYTELLLANAIAPEEQQHSLRTILSSVLHLQRLIDDILEFSRLDADKVEVELVPYSPLAIVEEIREILLPKSDAKGLNLDIEYLFPIPKQILTDPTRLKQILINLVGNAIKFTHQGQVSITVAYSPTDEQLTFEVVDTGIGISDEQAANLFQPFSQGDCTITREFGGSGLGLYISRALAEKLGGSLTFESIVDQGTIFTVKIATGQIEETTLIYTREQQNSLFQPLSLAKLPRLSGKVLLAEDGINNSEVITFILKNLGLEVTPVENGELACAKALAEDFSLILMDMHMPILDGVSATRKLRALGYSRPIIAVTADRSAESIEVCRSAGCDDFISKPFRGEQFAGVLKRFLQ